MIFTIKCPHCGEDIKIDPASLLRQIESEKRKEASRENGKKGGRPKNSDRK